MKKVLIFGNSGSGKSTLAKEIAEEYKLAHLDLDTLAWLPSVPPMRTPIDEAGRNIKNFTDSNSAWVIEGCYADLMDLVATKANELIFMDISIEQCIENAKKRPWEAHKYESKEAQDANLDMLINWIENYVERDDAFSYKAHCEFYEKYSGDKIKYINNDREQV